MDFSAIDKISREFIEKGYFPSATVAVFDKNGVIYEGAYGENEMPDGSIVKTNKDTAYDMASCTKIVTSTMILQLIDEGKLRLETRLPEVLTEIKDREKLYERTRSVTIYQLLTHTSGILDWYPFYVQKGKDYFDVFESFIGDTKIVDGMEYSDMNFMLLGRVVERITGKSLETCAKEFAFSIGAKRMEYCMEKDPEMCGNIAPSCWGNSIEERMVAERGLTFNEWRSKDRPVIGCNDGNAHYFHDDVCGHAGICASAESYARLGIYYLNTESELMLRSMTEQEDGRGLGWQISESLYPEGCGHTGFSGTWIYVCREKGFGVVTLTNRLAFPTEHGTNTHDYRRAIAACVREILA